MNDQQYDSALQYATVMSPQAGQKETAMSAIKALVDEKETINTIYFRLTGMKKIRNPETNDIEDVGPYHTPLMSPEGADELVNLFSSYLVKNISLSWFTEKKIEKYSYIFDKVLRDYLVENMYNFGIYSDSKMAQIFLIMTTHYNAVLSRSLNGLTLRTALENVNVQEHIVSPDGQSQNQGGIFRRLGKR